MASIFSGGRPAALAAASCAQAGYDECQWLVITQTAISRSRNDRENPVRRCRPSPPMTLASLGFST